MAVYVVGITGGVASGKSTVAALFESLGVSIVDADVIARQIVAPGEPALEEIAARFGSDILLADGSLDRVKLRALVFADAEAKRDLESISHPRIRSTIRTQCADAPGPYVMAAIPLLAELGAIAAYSWLARVLVVDAPVAVQQARVIARDRIAAALAQRMIQAQATREERLAVASDVIINDGAIDELSLPVDRLHRFYQQASSN